MMRSKYSNAYAEVYEILKYLDKNEYNKIPKQIIEVINENRNKNYNYKINSKQDIMEQPMLVESKALLLNIFRDYLATPNQKNKIKIWQEKDRRIIEMKKQEKYDINIFEKKNILNTKNISKAQKDLIKTK